jgi:hypothetical protein
MDRFLIFQTQNSVYMDTIAIAANKLLLLILKNHQFKTKILDSYLFDGLHCVCLFSQKTNL